MKDFFIENGIDEVSCIPLSECKILKEYLLTKNGFDKEGYAITMLIPYRPEKAPDNLSVYASVKDYHAYVDTLSKKLDDYVAEKYPCHRFKLFADHSPIDEVHAACISGLGFIGDNGLLISEKYSSFVFLAECITNAIPEEIGLSLPSVTKVRECLHCGKCATACPSGCIKKRGDVDDFNPKSLCLSAITQKKGELTENEEAMMLTHNTAWGCDICQNVCPYTKNAEYTPIDYFKKDLILRLDVNTLEKMSDTEFMRRPFSWRGRGVVLRNAKLFEKGKTE